MARGSKGTPFENLTFFFFTYFLDIQLHILPVFLFFFIVVKYI